jgi:hypothetical protein
MYRHVPSIVFRLVINLFVVQEQNMLSFQIKFSACDRNKTQPGFVVWIEQSKSQPHPVLDKTNGSASFKRGAMTPAALFRTCDYSLLVVNDLVTSTSSFTILPGDVIHRYQNCDHDFRTISNELPYSGHTLLINFSKRERKLFYARFFSA